MTEDRKRRAEEFAEYWKDRGYEKGESQPFWLELLENVFGVENPARFISFEDKVMLDHAGFIDGYIPSSRVMIEQKSRNKDLRKPVRQSDGTLLTPFQQAKRYVTELPVSKHPRFIVVSTFTEFLIYDMEKPSGEPESILLKDLPNEYYRLTFLTDRESELLKREMAVSVQAGDIVGALYDKLLAQYRDPDERSLKSLNALCVRLVFCLYAEDADIFGRRSLFHDYLDDIAPSGIRRALEELFKILDTPEEKRSKYLADDNPKLAEFPYVNGGLFADENIEIPQMNDKIRELLLKNASEEFDWSAISPTIFGAVFESTLNPETRRSGGMHYTSIENIYKVTDPLFLNDLKSELDGILEIKTAKTRIKRLEAFTDKLSSLKFLDPACGSGNFLTETYMSLRRLENRALEEIQHGQIIFDMGNIIKVSIGQFYGIEINDFAVTVAKTALWIAESQMMKETESIVHMSLDFLPLKSYANITEGNALRLDWNETVPKRELNYIMGNPPFVGARLMSKEQKDDVLSVYGAKWKKAGNIDYVSGWYFKAAELMKNTDIRTAFVSTNSITQGEQTAGVWKPLYDRLGIRIDFAHRTFKWNSEANGKAAVHCVIVGFSADTEKREKYIYTGNRPIKAENINPYLVDAPNVFVESRKKPLCDVPTLVFGSMPNDSGFLSDYSEEERNSIVAEYPEAAAAFKRFVGATEFINNKVRWCMWLKDVSPNIIRNIPPIAKAVSSVREMREKSNREATRKLADVPALFGEIRQPDTDYIVVPRVSSERRKYIPMGFLNPDFIASDAVQILPNATLYHYGVLTSNVHMAWVRAVCGRLKSDYRYSVNIVYNNFPWCSPTDEQKAKIKETAQGILNARALYPDCSLADLYDEITMPPELRKAHRENDRAVMRAYGFDVKTMTESMCVSELMKMYRELTE